MRTPALLDIAPGSPLASQRVHRRTTARSPPVPANAALRPAGDDPDPRREPAPFRETFLGNSPSPRLSVGFGVNWNSPFGPFRIDIARALLSEPGDDTKLFSFNVGTAF